MHQELILLALISLGVSNENFLSQAETNSVRHDETMMSGSKGCVLVQSVLEKIGRISFNPDYMFMSRAAYAASEFWLNPVDEGGIWAVTIEQWNIIHADGGLSKYKQEIQTEFSINWNDLAYENTDVPMYSGLAARMYLSIIEREHVMPFSSQRQDQAKLYARFTGVEADYSKFLEKLSNLEKEGNSQNCVKCETQARKLDLMVIMDESRSITAADYIKEKQFVGNLADKFVISQNSTRISIITFSSDVNTAHDFNLVSSNVPFRSKISSLVRKSGGTNCKAAFSKALALFHSQYGSRIDDSAVQKVLLFLTDGQCNESPNAEVYTFKQNRDAVNIFAIGVGPNTDENTLSMIASKPQNVHKLENGFDALLLMSSFIEQEVCSSVMKIKAESNMDLEIGKSPQQMDFEEIQPENEFIVVINASYDHGVVMEAAWSFVIEKPTVSYNDGFKTISSQLDGLLRIYNRGEEPATLHFSLRSSGNENQPVVVMSGTEETLAEVI